MTRLPRYNLLEPGIVAFVSVCLGASLQKNQLLAASKQSANGKSHQSAESREIISFALSKDVRKYLVGKPDTYDPVVMRRWAVDQLAVYLWALGVIDKKPLVEVKFTAEELCAKIPLSGNLTKFLEKAWLRPISELYPLELALDLYGSRVEQIKFGETFDDSLQERVLNKAKNLLSQGYLVSAPRQDLVLHGQEMPGLDPFELEQIYELTLCRTCALFYVFRKFGG